MFIPKVKTLFIAALAVLGAMVVGILLTWSLALSWLAAAFLCAFVTAAFVWRLLGGGEPVLRDFRKWFWIIGIATALLSLAAFWMFLSIVTGNPLS
jgi:hypothetical protein